MTLCQIESCDVQMMNWGSKRIGKQAHICYALLSRDCRVLPLPASSSSSKIISTSSIQLRS